MSSTGHEMIEIFAADDPRMAPYRAVRDQELLRNHDLFVAEGENLVLRLAASRYPMHSLLVAANRADDFLRRLARPQRCYIASEALLAAIAGFSFHRGVLALGRRLPLPQLPDWYPQNPRAQKWVVLCGLQDAENIGVLLRTCAAFGVDAIVLDAHTIDPFYRRVIRVSMGAVFSLPLVRSDDLGSDINFLQQKVGAALYATVLSDSATPLHDVQPAAAWALLLGNEYHGLDASNSARCDHRITLPMRPGIDSLNVAVAAGIFLYHFCRPGQPQA